jgi:hypothetical protein
MDAEPPTGSEFVAVQQHFLTLSLRGGRSATSACSRLVVARLAEFGGSRRWHAKGEQSSIHGIGITLRRLETAIDRGTNTWPFRRGRQRLPSAGFSKTRFSRRASASKRGVSVARWSQTGSMNAIFQRKTNSQAANGS